MIIHLSYQKSKLISIHNKSIKNNNKIKLNYSKINNLNYLYYKTNKHNQAYSIKINNKNRNIQ